MISRTLLISLLALTFSGLASASVFLPYEGRGSTARFSKFSTTLPRENASNKQVARMRRSYSTNGAAVAIPGYGIAEQVFVGGFQNFLSIYNIVITGRILLSWFPQAQSVGILQPIYQITDPYLNLFRNIIPPVFGLDLSPLLAFFLLNALTSATAAVGADLTIDAKKKLQNTRVFASM